MASAAEGVKDRGRDHYWNLIRRFPLRHLRSDAELAEASKMIDTLIVRGDLAAGEQEYLDVLTGLVERYEAKAHPIEPVADAEVLRHLLEAREITQQRLAKDVGIAMSTISEILNGKRNLTRAQVVKVSQYFAVSPLVFSSTQMA